MGAREDVHVPTREHANHMRAAGEHVADTDPLWLRHLGRRASGEGSCHGPGQAARQRQGQGRAERGLQAGSAAGLGPHRGGLALSRVCREGRANSGEAGNPGASGGGSSSWSRESPRAWQAPSPIPHSRHEEPIQNSPCDAWAS